MATYGKLANIIDKVIEPYIGSIEEVYNTIPSKHRPISSMSIVPVIETGEVFPIGGDNDPMNIVRSILNLYHKADEKGKRALTYVFESIWDSVQGLEEDSEIDQSRLSNIVSDCKEVLGIEEESYEDEDNGYTDFPMD